MLTDADIFEHPGVQGVVCRHVVCRWGNHGIDDIPERLVLHELETEADAFPQTRSVPKVLPGNGN